METKNTPDYERGLTFEQIWASIKELRDSQKITEQLLRENAEREKENAERQKENAELEKKNTEQVRQNIERQKQEDEERWEKDKQRWEEDKQWWEENKRRWEEDKQRWEEDKQRWEKTDRQNEEDKRRSEEADRRLEKTERIVRKNGKQMGDLHRRFGELAEHLVAPSINKRFNDLGYHFGDVSPQGRIIEDEKKKVKTEIDILLENGSTIMAIEVKVQPAVKDVEHHIKRLEILRDYRRGINDKRKIEGAIAGAIFGTEEKKATIEAGLYVIEQSGDTMMIEVPEGFIPRKW